MKVMRLVMAICAVLAATSGVARADLILLGATPADAFIDLGAQGYGNAPRLLTTETGNNDFLAGGVTPVDQEFGEAVEGSNKSTTPTLGVLGWTSGAEVGIGFNSSQQGNTGITMQELILTIYIGTTAVVGGTFSLGPAFINFSGADLALQPGNGNAVFGFGLDAVQQALFDTILAMPGSSNFYAGLYTELGCDGSGDPAGCMKANDGPDSYVGFVRGTETPVPDSGSTLSLLGAVFLGIGMVRRRMTRF